MITVRPGHCIGGGEWQGGDRGYIYATCACCKRINSWPTWSFDNAGHKVEPYLCKQCGTADNTYILDGYNDE